jgi:hypothetical protein
MIDFKLQDDTLTRRQAEYLNLVNYAQNRVLGASFSDAAQAKAEYEALVNRTDEFFGEGTLKESEKAMSYGWMLSRLSNEVLSAVHSMVSARDAGSIHEFTEYADYYSLYLWEDKALSKYMMEYDLPEFDDDDEYREAVKAFG